MSDLIRDILGTLLLVTVAMGPLALSKKARINYRFAVRISIITFVVLIPLIYIGTFLQAPQPAIEHPVNYLMTGYLFCMGVIVAGNLLWRFFVMPRFNKHV